MKRYMCVVCGFIYDEAEGWPAEGIQPGTRWEEVHMSIPDIATLLGFGVTNESYVG